MCINYRRILNISVLVLAAVVIFTGSAAAQEQKKSSGKSAIFGRTRSIAREILALDRKKYTPEPGSRAGIHYSQKRALLSLELIHEGQKELMKYNPQDGSMQELRKLMENEVFFLKELLKNVKYFPYPDYLMDTEKLIKEIRSGKIDYGKKVPNKDSVLIKEIQDEQRKALEEHFRQMLHNHRK